VIARGGENIQTAAPPYAWKPKRTTSSRVSKRMEKRSISHQLTPALNYISDFFCGFSSDPFGRTVYWKHVTFTEGIHTMEHSKPYL